MDIKEVWHNIINDLREGSEELPTVPSNTAQPKWFMAYLEEGDVYVDNAINHTPRTNISTRRKIKFSDFYLVASYYERWVKGETGIRNEVSSKSWHSAYILGLISKHYKTA